MPSENTSLGQCIDFVVRFFFPQMEGLNESLRGATEPVQRLAFG